MGWKLKLFLFILFSPIIVPACLFTPIGPILFLGVLIRIAANYKKFMREVGFYARRITAVLWSPFAGTKTSPKIAKPATKPDGRPATPPA